MCRRTSSTGSSEKGRARLDARCGIPENRRPRKWRKSPKKTKKPTKARSAALNILRRENLPRDTYGPSFFSEDDVQEVTSHLREYLERPENSEFSVNAGLEDVARELLEIGKEAEGKKKKLKWLAQWETDSTSDGIECKTFAEAKWHAISCLEEWVTDTRIELEDAVHSGKKTRQQALDDWNYMYWNYSACVMKLNPETGEYEDVWYPSEKELNEIGMKGLTEWEMPEDGE